MSATPTTRSRQVSCPRAPRGACAWWVIFRAEAHGQPKSDRDASPSVTLAPFARSDSKNWCSASAEEAKPRGLHRDREDLRHDHVRDVAGYDSREEEPHERMRDGARAKCDRNPGGPSPWRAARQRSAERRIDGAYELRERKAGEPRYEHGSRASSRATSSLATRGTVTRRSCRRHHAFAAPSTAAHRYDRDIRAARTAGKNPPTAP